MRKAFLILLVLVLLLGGVGLAFMYSPFVQSLYSLVVSDGGVSVERGLRYGPGDRRLLDVYRPAGREPSRAIVIFVYGGGWRAGHRNMYGFVGAALAARGITTVIPDYRLYPEAVFPEFVSDVAYAYAWVEKNLGEPGQRPIVLIGHSAGAHIAALLAFEPKYLVSAGAIHRPAGFVGLAGPYAFDPTTYETTAEIFRKATSANEARPVTHVRPGAPPALLLHGSADDMVKLWNTETLAGTLTEHGVTVRKSVVPGLGHLGIVLALSWPFRSGAAPVLEEIVAFVAESETRAKEPSPAL